MSRRTLAVVVAVVVAVVAFALWKWRGEASSPTGAGSAAGRAPAVHGAAPAKRPDPKTVARGTLAGTVKQAGGELPIAHARVCADGDAPDLPSELFRDSSCAETDDHGRYAIANLLPATYRVSATAPRFRPGIHQVGGDRDRTAVRIAAGERKDGIDIALRPGGVELTGVVADLTGGPVARAKVWAEPGGFRRFGATAHTETDDQGRFSLWVAPGDVRVLAAAEGYADGEESATAPGKIEVLLTPESSLAGTVTDAQTGQPVEGARVLVGTRQFGFDSGDTVFSDAQGHFRATRLTPGRYVAVARTDRGYGRTEGSVLVGLGQHVEPVDVKLFPAARLEGAIVIAGTKQPCEHGGVRLRTGDGDGWLMGSMRDGAVAIEGVLPGTYTVTVTCEGYRSRDKYDPVKVAGADVTGLVWEVEAGATIRGKVLTKAGAAIDDAAIVARTIGGAGRDATGWQTATSGTDGAYAFEGLKPGRYKLELMGGRGVEPAEGFQVDVAAGATVDKDLVLDDGGAIHGTVVDADGKPVAGVEVSAEPLAGDGRAIVMRFGPGPRSDELGAFAIESLRAGDYRVTAQRSWRDELRKPGTTDDAKQGERTTVRAGQVATVTLVVESQSGAIRGTVVDAAGKPVPDAYVVAARESDAAGAGAGRVQDTRWTWDERPNLTTVEGAFTIGKLSPGAYTLRAYRKGGGEAVAEHVAVGATAKLQIKATGSIEGVVKSTGELPARISVSLSDPKTGFDRDDTFFRTAGRFALRDLPQGHYQLEVEGGGASKQLELDLAEGEAKTGVTLELEGAVSITGRVVELATKKPVPGMRIMAMPAGGGGGNVFSFDDAGDNITDETGAFTIKHAPRGKVVLRAFPKDFAESDYDMAASVRTIEGTGTVDVGELVVVKKRVKRGDPVGELGVRFAEMPPGTTPDQRVFKVSFIEPAGPAAKSGLVVGDVITSVDGTDITGPSASVAWPLLRAAPGTKLTLGLARKATVVIVLGAPS